MWHFATLILYLAFHLAFFALFSKIIYKIYIYIYIYNLKKIDIFFQIVFENGCVQHTSQYDPKLRTKYFYISKCTWAIKYAYFMEIYINII